MAERQILRYETNAAGTRVPVYKTETGASREVGSASSRESQQSGSGLASRMGKSDDAPDTGGPQRSDYPAGLAGEGQYAAAKRNYRGRVAGQKDALSEIGKQ